DLGADTGGSATNTPTRTNTTGATATKTNTPTGPTATKTNTPTGPTATKTSTTAPTATSSGCTLTPNNANGTRWAIPGTVQAEDYDKGGEGCGYHDADTSNQGGQYRSDGVDIESSTDTNGGYDVGYTAAGEWLNYSINVTAGTYAINVRVASNGSGGTFHVNLDGSNVSGTLTV